MTYAVGTKVRVSLSDAPEFVATIDMIQEDPKFGTSYRISRRNGSWNWISDRRIVAARVATGSITGQEIWKSGDSFYCVCSCGLHSPEFPSNMDAQGWARAHWTTKPYCSPNHS